MAQEPVMAVIQKEKNQGHETRKTLYEKLEKLLGRPVISIFTSFRYPVMLEDDDADMLSDILQAMDIDDGIAVLLHSPGGSGLAAERIINILRSYSGTGDYYCIVPNKAKSAATMIAFGGSKIVMSKASELGPVDPQIQIKDGDQIKVFSVFNIIKTYDELFKKAEHTKGHLEPYLLQLQNCDAREIQEFRASMELSKDIAIRALKTGMMSKVAPKEIGKKIKLFLTPEQTKTHGRPIFIPEAVKAGLTIDEINVKSEHWNVINELYIRLNQFVSTLAVKCIEGSSHSFVVSAKQ